jgi:hypothetical protein
MDNWKRNMIEFLNKEELILFFGWNKLLREWISEWSNFMSIVKIGNILIESNNLKITISLSNGIEQEICLMYSFNYDEFENQYEQILKIEYTSNYNPEQNIYTNVEEEITRKTDPIQEKEFVLSYINILFINFYTKYNHLE